MNGKKDKIVIIMEGGLIEDVITERPAEYLVIHNDLMDTEEPDVVFGKERHIGTHAETDTAGEYRHGPADWFAECGIEPEPTAIDMLKRMVSMVDAAGAIRRSGFDIPKKYWLDLLQVNDVAKALIAQNNSEG